MSIVTLTAYRGYQDIGTVGQNVQQLAGNVQSINQLLDVGVGNTHDYTHMFVRVEHLIGLGFVSLLNGNQLAPVTPTYPASTVAQLPLRQLAGARAFCNRFDNEDIPRYRYRRRGLRSTRRV